MKICQWHACRGIEGDLQAKAGVIATYFAAKVNGQRVMAHVSGVDDSQLDQAVQLLAGFHLWPETCTFQIGLAHPLMCVASQIGSPVQWEK